MYKPYPELNQEQQLETLEPLNLDLCCSRLDILEQWREENKKGANKDKSAEYQLFHLMMLNGSPVLHLYSTDGQLNIFDLSDGKLLSGITEKNALEIAKKYAKQHSYPAPSLDGLIQKDQWTVYGSYNAHRPLYHFLANDDVGTQWYISSRSGEIVQITTREQRVWGYLGPVIHWLYPTILREKAQLWNQTVIWLSILGTFLTLAGIYFGLKQYKARRKGGFSPYKGVSLWHHYTGLVFGLFTLTWVVSGLFSMQPWGLFEGSGAGSEAQRLRGGSISIGEINKSLARLNQFSLSNAAVLLEGKNLRGELFLTSLDSELNKKRYNAASFEEVALTNRDLKSLAELMLPNEKIEQAEMLYEEDSYYFSHHNKVSLPVYKVVADNADKTIYYLSAADGSILKKVDSASKGFRWFHYGLHRLDFSRITRSRPLWDVIMWSLLSGVTLGVFTGLFLGVRRVYRSF